MKLVKVFLLWSFSVSVLAHATSNISGGKAKNVSCALLIPKVIQYWDQKERPKAGLRFSFPTLLRRETPLEAHLRLRKEANKESPIRYNAIQAAVKSLKFISNDREVFITRENDGEKNQLTLHCPGTLRDHPVVLSLLVYHLDQIELDYNEAFEYDSLYRHYSAMSAQWYFLHAQGPSVVELRRQIRNSSLSEAIQDRMVLLLNLSLSSLETFIGFHDMRIHPADGWRLNDGSPLFFFPAHLGSSPR